MQENNLTVFSENDASPYRYFLINKNIWRNILHHIAGAFYDVVRQLDKL